MTTYISKKPYWAFFELLMICPVKIGNTIHKDKSLTYIQLEWF